MQTAIQWLRENAWSRVDFHPTPPELRKHAAATLIFFALLGAILCWRIGDRHTAWTVGIALWSLGAVWAAATLIPGLGRYADVAFACLTGLFGMAVMFILVGVIFLAVFSVAKGILRLSSKDLLDRRRFRRNAGSAWIEHRPPPPPEQYRHLS